MRTHVGSVNGLSVIVPMLNEAARLRGFLERLRAAGEHEYILVDGGSRDQSVQIGREYCDQIFVDTGGLARQLNRGAQAAHGEVFFFPHVDAELPERWDEIIFGALRDSRSVGGAFRLAFNSERTAYRVIAFLANLRTAAGVGPFGDQGIFVRRSAFLAVGGFRDDVLLEDWDFVSRLRSHGRVRVVPEPVRTSVRRWEANGIAMTSLRNCAYLARHMLFRADASGCRSYRNYRSGGHESG